MRQNAQEDNTPVEEQEIFSIIILSYNASAYIEQCVESAMDQNWRNKEVIVIDDGSSDDSVSLVQRYKGVKIIEKQNGAQASAMNIGFANCKGKYILFLDGDDFLYPDALRDRLRMGLAV